MRSKDIAKIAGVSRSTVSRVVNNYSNVPEKTRKKVMKIVDEYGYTPNSSARILAGKAGKTIGVFVTEVQASDKRSVIKASGYFSQFISYIIYEADKYDYNVLVSIINDKKDFNNVKKIFLNKTISGGIFIGEKQETPEIKELIKKKCKIGLVDQKQTECLKNSVIVNSDDFKGAYKATEYLIQNGHKRIMHLSGDLKKNSGKEREKGYEEALKDYNMEIKKEYILNGDFTEESGYIQTKAKFDKLEQKPTAIFVSSDSMAIGAIKALNELGYKIPEDISIIGYDNIELSKYTNPRLSTVDVGMGKMAKTMVFNLVNLIEEKENIKYNNKVETTVIIRESTKKIFNKIESKKD